MGLTDKHAPTTYSAYSAPIGTPDMLMKKKTNRSRMAVSMGLLAGLLHLPDDVVVQGVTVEQNDFGQPVLYFIIEGGSVPADAHEVNAIFETVHSYDAKFKRFEVLG